MQYNCLMSRLFIAFTVPIIFTQIECITAFDQPIVYHNHFAIRLPADRAQAVADKYGFLNLGQIGSLKGYYLFEHPRLQKRSLQPHVQHHFNLKQEPGVEWVMQQREQLRNKRDGATQGIGANRVFNNYQHFPDPLYDQQWYLNGGAEDGMDMNVGPAWARGYTGKGVVVSILDDGIQTNHPDLIDNYDSKASWDINDNDDDPMPRDNEDNKHGTRCAGEVAAAAYNKYCGVGVAYNASIGGVRMLDGSVNDAVEASALSLNPDHIDIYSASWGPEDDGKTVDGPGPLATKAFINGVTKGRGGKGSIYVWASGNGGRHVDSCNCDGYTNSIYTLSISSATQAGMKPWYLEECSSTIATTYSSGLLGRDKSVASVDMDPLMRPDRLCTTEHTGTSASAPLAAGMVALALEANPNLTWRDVQHIVVMSAKSKPLEKETGWTTNGAKRKVSHKFGFGLMDGEVMVTLAEKWTTVPRQHVCRTPEVIENRTIGSIHGSRLIVTMNVTGCASEASEVRYVEQVQCVVSLTMVPRGNLRLVLTSAQGTQSTLLYERPRDTLSSNFEDWPFLSVHFWGEDPVGVWSLTVINGGNGNVRKSGVLHKWQLVIYGTDINPIPSQPNNRQDVGSDPKKISGFGKTLALSQSCHSQCGSGGCYGAKSYHCVRCLNFKLSKRCVQKCPIIGYYPTFDGNQGTGVCVKCHESCLSCSGPGPDECLICRKNFFNTSDLSLCINHCPPSYYQDVLNARCVSCSDNCSTCHRGPDICSSCPPHFALFKGKCIESCPSGTYRNHFNRCIDCFGRNCIPVTGDIKLGDVFSNRLQFNYTGDLYEPRAKALGGNRHQPECNPRVSNECKACWSGCEDCNGTGRFDCLACIPGLTLNELNECVSTCPRNTYPSNVTSSIGPVRGCSRCHHSCSTCNGVSFNVSSTPQLTMTFGLNQTVSTNVEQEMMNPGGSASDCTKCTLGRYMELSSGLCLACDPDCVTCSGPRRCTSCHRRGKIGQCPDQTGSCKTCVNTSELEVFHPGGKRNVDSTPEYMMASSIRWASTFSRSSSLTTLMAIIVSASLLVVALVIIIFRGYITSIVRGLEVKNLSHISSPSTVN